MDVDLQTWRVEIEFAPGRSEKTHEVIETVGRPTVTLGEGMFRLYSFNGERWFPKESIKTVTVTTPAEHEAFTYIRGADHDALRRRARELKDTDETGFVAGSIIEKMLDRQTAIDEVETLVRQQLPQEDSS